MNKIIQTNLVNLWTEDREQQNQAFFYILKVTDKPVDWAYEAWDDIVKNLNHKDNHNRAIAAQILCALAKSDPKERILKDFDKLQALWKVGVAGKKQQQRLMDGLTYRFTECAAEKNCTLIRYDILQSLRNVYDATKDERIKIKALELIETEKDIKYQKKYSTVWKAK
jgi:hypothetical protein